ncbi:MAG TPA: hypothetical protein VEX65_06775, partial [Flavisolibacter sp.]|nr:hypothetical protein [Flavisolibacter sp.]
ISCKGKKKTSGVPEEDHFPVSSYLKGQLAQLDTSLSSFYKVETADGKSDTVAIKNSEVRQYAADFAGLPDIGSKDLKDDYELTKEYDDILKALVFIYTTKEKHPVRREDVVMKMEQDEQGRNEVQSVFVELWNEQNDTVVRKNMLWEPNKNFRITTVTEAGGAQKTKKLQVFWNGFEGQNR